jgi:hypothetical protein
MHAATEIAGSELIAVSVGSFGIGANKLAVQVTSNRTSKKRTYFTH